MDWRGRRFTLCANFLGVKQKALGYRRASGTNDHIEQSHTIFFADDAMGSAFYCLVAVSAYVIHTCSYGNENAMIKEQPEAPCCHLKSSVVNECYQRNIALYEGNSSQLHRTAVIRLQLDVIKLAGLDRRSRFTLGMLICLD
jgi:hypothetical protein